MDFKVCIRCFTFNHSKFITQAMDGFVMQQTDFPFVCCIVDDASTDGEPEVILKYLQENFEVQGKSVVRTEETDDYVLFFKQHSLNTNCFFAVYFLKYNHYSIKKPKFLYLKEWLSAKYTALCEGDDYWTSPYKLQLQVDYLEANDKCSMCFHNADAYSFYDKKYINKFFLPGKSRNYYSKHIFTKGWFVPTASMVYRSSVLHSYFSFPKWAKKKNLGGDIRTLMFLSKAGYFRYISQKMSVYRFGSPGSATERSAKLSNNQAHLVYLEFLSDSNKYLFHWKYTIFVWYKFFLFSFHKLAKWFRNS